MNVVVSTATVFKIYFCSLLILENQADVIFHDNASDLSDWNVSTYDDNYCCYVYVTSTTDSNCLQNQCFYFYGYYYTEEQTITSTLISTENYHHIQLQYYMKVTELESSENCVALYSVDGGNNFIVLSQMSSSSNNQINNQLLTLPATVDNNPNFQIKFVLQTNNYDGEDYCYVDEITVYGTPITSSSPSFPTSNPSSSTENPVLAPTSTPTTSTPTTPTENPTTSIPTTHTENPTTSNPSTLTPTTSIPTKNPFLALISNTVVFEDEQVSVANSSTLITAMVIVSLMILLVVVIGGYYCHYKSKRKNEPNIEIQAPNDIVEGVNETDKDSSKNKMELAALPAAKADTLIVGEDMDVDLKNVENNDINNSLDMEVVEEINETAEINENSKNEQMNVVDRSDYLQFRFGDTFSM